MDNELQKCRLVKTRFRGIDNISLSIDVYVVGNVCFSKKWM